MNGLWTYLLSPAVLVTVLAYCVTFVLRHRLYVYAATYRPRRGEVVHVFVVQNLEIIDLDIPLQVQVSTVNNAGDIREIRMHSGKRGPQNWDARSSDSREPKRLDPRFGGFEAAGVQRFVRVSNGISALDTWRIECITNEDAKEVRLVLRGWDISRRCERWWVPTFQRGGVHITSRAEDVNNLYTRPVRWIAWVMIALMVVGYLYAIGGLAGITPGDQLPPPFPTITRYVASVSYPFSASLDLGILGVLIVLGILARRLVMRSHWQDVSLGYLGDPFLHQIVGDTRSTASTHRSNP